MNPPELKSEQVAVIDHMRGVDHMINEQLHTLGDFACLFNQNRGDGFHCDDRPAVQIHRAHCATFRLCPIETRRQGGAAAALP